MSDTFSYENLLAVAKGRKSVRKFISQKIPAKDIEKILEVARTSPFAGGRKDWDIHVVDDPLMIQKFKELVQKNIDIVAPGVKKEFRKMFLDYSEYFTTFDSAPVLLIPVFKVQKGIAHLFQDDPLNLAELDREGVIKSIACVSMLILLAAQSLGYGSCFVHGACIADREIVQTLQLKKNRRIGAIIPIGYEEKEHTK